MTLDLTCLHAPAGLCPACQADHDEDPTAYLEFGAHPAGIANQKALQEEMARDRELAALRDPVPADPNIPF